MLACIYTSTWVPTLPEPKYEAFRKAFRNMPFAQSHSAQSSNTLRNDGAPPPRAAAHVYQDVSSKGRLRKVRKGLCKGVREGVPILKIMIYYTK